MGSCRCLGKGLCKYCMLKRDLCPVCYNNPVAINYIHEDVYHYRNSCAACIRKGKKLPKLPPLWAKSGYKKKDRCELCNFKAKSMKQLFVYHVDGNLKNINSFNLKTVCANCQIELIDLKLPWKPASILPDF